MLGCIFIMGDQVKESGYTGTTEYIYGKRGYIGLV